MEKGDFIIRNQLGQYWIRAGEWVDGREPQRVQRFHHRDEAVNQLVELSAKDIELRGEILEPALDDRGEPLLEVSEHRTPSLAERAAARAAAEREAAAQAAAEADAAGETAGDAGDDGGEAGDDDGEEPPSAAAV